MTPADSKAATAVTPVLRWAGGKRWLVPTLPKLLESTKFKEYHEPFLGGGSVFFGVAPRGMSYLRDLNPELIETYECIRDEPDEVAKALRGHSNTEEHYYKLRDMAPIRPADRAARFLYLNHTSFNGIYRVNLKGIYNVPYGYRANPQIPTRDQLLAVSRRLSNAVLSSGDFADALPNIKEGDLVFLDPPYTVAHNHNGFIKYNQKLFSFKDQQRLSLFIDAVRKCGAHYVMTNAAHSSIADLFEKGDRRIETSRRNSIGGNLAARGRATEFLFTNVPGDV